MKILIIFLVFLVAAQVWNFHYNFVGLLYYFLCLFQQSQAAPCTPAELEALLGALNKLYQQYNDAIAKRPPVAPTDAPPASAPTDAPVAEPTEAPSDAPANPPGFFSQIIDNGFKYAEKMGDAVDKAVANFENQ